MLQNVSGLDKYHKQNLFLRWPMTAWKQTEWHHKRMVKAAWTMIPDFAVAQSLGLLESPCCLHNTHTILVVTWQTLTRSSSVYAAWWPPINARGCNHNHATPKERSLLRLHLRSIPAVLVAPKPVEAGWGCCWPKPTAEKGAGWKGAGAWPGALLPAPKALLPKVGPEEGPEPKEGLLPAASSKHCNTADSPHFLICSLRQLHKPIWLFWDWKYWYVQFVYAHFCVKHDQQSCMGLGFGLHRIFSVATAAKSPFSRYELQTLLNLL